MQSNYGAIRGKLVRSNGKGEEHWGSGIPDRVLSCMCPDGVRRDVIITGEILYMSTMPGYIRIDGKAVVGQVYPINAADPLSSFADDSNRDWRFTIYEDQSGAATIVADRHFYFKDNGL